jgi:homoserine dehydrogenase
MLSSTVTSFQGRIKKTEANLMTIRVLLPGFGNVGRRFCKLLEKGEHLEESGRKITLVGVATRERGSLWSDEGIPPGKLLEAERQTRRVDALSLPGVKKGIPVLEMIRDGNYDILAECTSGNLKTVEYDPGFSHMKSALERGKPVATTNKTAVALKFGELEALSKSTGVAWHYDGTVVVGTPFLDYARTTLSEAGIRAFEGTLSSTCNYVLDSLMEGASLDQALMDAQRSGMAESDPTLDIEGWDTAAKAMIVAQALMEAPCPGLGSFPVRGIRGLTRAMLAEARQTGGKIRLLARISRSAEGVELSVGPELLPPTHPLSLLFGPTNGGVILTEGLGEVCFSGTGSSPRQAAYALLQDIRKIVRSGGRR